MTKYSGPGFELPPPIIFPVKSEQEKGGNSRISVDGADKKEEVPGKQMF